MRAGLRLLSCRKLRQEQLVLYPEKGHSNPKCRSQNNQEADEESVRVANALLEEAVLTLLHLLHNLINVGCHRAVISAQDSLPGVVGFPRPGQVDTFSQNRQ